MRTCSYLRKLFCTFQPIENNEVPEYVSEIPAFMALLQPPPVGRSKFFFHFLPFKENAIFKFGNI